jgi:hypothetical protein
MKKCIGFHRIDKRIKWWISYRKQVVSCGHCSADLPLSLVSITSVGLQMLISSWTIRFSGKCQLNIELHFFHQLIPTSNEWVPTSQAQAAVIQKPQPWPIKSATLSASVTVPYQTAFEAHPAVIASFWISFPWDVTRCTLKTNVHLRKLMKTGFGTCSEWVLG